MYSLEPLATTHEGVLKSVVMVTPKTWLYSGSIPQKPMNVGDSVGTSCVLIKLT